MVFVPAARPPQHYERVHEWTLETAEDVRRVRAEIAERAVAVGDWDPDAPEVLDRLVLVCSELASNALTHARPPVCVGLETSPSRFLVDVSDDDLGTSPVLADGPDDEGGLGLTLTSALASSSGWYVSGGRKHVWATFVKRSAGRLPSEPGPV